MVSKPTYELVSYRPYLRRSLESAEGLQISKDWKSEIIDSGIRMEFLELHSGWSARRHQDLEGLAELIAELGSAADE
jgi:hypothetical protein